MTPYFPPTASEATTVRAILIDAARCWREARNRGQSVQPALSQILNQYDCAMLAPVFDSLYLFYEAALGQPMTVGEALTLSDDERRLLGLMDGSKLRDCLICPQDVVAALDCALCSTRIMLALTIVHPRQLAHYNGRRR
jgi:hypothetical protein